MSDFIEDFANFLTTSIGTSREWAEDIATAVLSTVIGPNRYMATSIGRLRLNTWFMYIGPSGIARKTLPLRDYVIPMLMEVEKKINKELLFPSSFSMEGMVEYLTQKNQGIIIRDEVSTLFKEIEGGKSYTTDLAEFLSQVYDGTVQKRYTRKARLETVLNCYVTFLGTTTPYLYEVIDRNVFVQGLGNRILFETWKQENPQKTNLSFLVRIQDEEREHKLKEFAEKLVSIYNSSIAFLTPDLEASELLSQFKQRCDEDAFSSYVEDKNNLLCSYYSRMGEMAIKLAGIKMFSRTIDVQGRTGLTEVLVRKDDALWAIRKVERHLSEFRQFLSQWETKALMVRPVSHRFTKESFIQTVKSSPYGMITQKELLRKLGWYLNARFYEMVDTVCYEGVVRKLSEDEVAKLPNEVKAQLKISERGARPIVYKYVGEGEEK